MNKKIDDLSVATIRSLCIDEINKANSGHPGMALGSAPILYTLFTRHLVADPKDPEWFNRDRFVLSAGHASALLYAMLHLSGYEVSLDDLKSFRQLGSLTPGHPEYRWTKGVDATSGPLGQGIAQAVGMAMAEESIRANYPEGNKIMNHYTYALCGDGCLQEGISQEAISLAGHQKLNKLILFYDANQVTLDGALDLSFSEQVKARFVASEWNVLEVADGNDIEDIDKAIVEAKKSQDKPTMILIHTVIGFGSAKQGTSKVHGSPLGAEDGKHAKVEVYGFDHEDFFIPEEVKEQFQNTLTAMEELCLDYSNTAAYSPREKTVAARWVDKFIDEDTKFERLARLNEQNRKCCLASNKKFVGRTLDVLIENFEDHKGKKVITGRTRNNKIVHIPSETDMTGEFLKVKITDCKTWYLIGELV